MKLISILIVILCLIIALSVTNMNIVINAQVIQTLYYNCNSGTSSLDISQPTNPNAILSFSEISNCDIHIHDIDSVFQILFPSNTAAIARNVSLTIRNVFSSTTALRSERGNGATFIQFNIEIENFRQITIENVHYRFEGIDSSIPNGGVVAVDFLQKVHNTHDDDGHESSNSSSSSIYINNVSSSGKCDRSLVDTPAGCYSYVIHFPGGIENVQNFTVRNVKLFNAQLFGNPVNGFEVGGMKTAGLERVPFVDISNIQVSDVVIGDATDYTGRTPSSVQEDPIRKVIHCIALHFNGIASASSRSGNNNNNNKFSVSGVHVNGVSGYPPQFSQLGEVYGVRLLSGNDPAVPSIANYSSVLFEYLTIKDTSNLKYTSRRRHITCFQVDTPIIVVSSPSSSSSSSLIISNNSNSLTFQHNLISNLTGWNDVIGITFYTAGVKGFDRIIFDNITVQGIYHDDLDLEFSEVILGQPTMLQTFVLNPFFGFKGSSSPSSLLSITNIHFRDSPHFFTKRSTATIYCFNHDRKDFSGFSSFVFDNMSIRDVTVQAKVSLSQMSFVGVVEIAGDLDNNTDNNDNNNHPTLLMQNIEISGLHFSMSMKTLNYSNATALSQFIDDERMYIRAGFSNEVKIIAVNFERGLPRSFEKVEFRDFIVENVTVSNSGACEIDVLRLVGSFSTSDSDLGMMNVTKVLPSFSVHNMIMSQVHATVYISTIQTSIFASIYGDLSGFLIFDFFNLTAQNLSLKSQKSITCSLLVTSSSDIQPVSMSSGVSYQHLQNDNYLLRLPSSSLTVSSLSFFDIVLETGSSEGSPMLNAIRIAGNIKNFTHAQFSNISIRSVSLVSNTTVVSVVRGFSVFPMPTASIVGPFFELISKNSLLSSSSSCSLIFTNISISQILINAQSGDVTAVYLAGGLISSYEYTEFSNIEMASSTIIINLPRSSSSSNPGSSDPPTRSRTAGGTFVNVQIQDFNTFRTPSSSNKVPNHHVILRVLNQRMQNVSIKTDGGSSLAIIRIFAAQGMVSYLARVYFSDFYLDQVTIDVRNSLGFALVSGAIFANYLLAISEGVFFQNWIFTRIRVSADVGVVRVDAVNPWSSVALHFPANPPAENELVSDFFISNIHFSEIDLSSGIIIVRDSSSDDEHHHQDEDTTKNYLLEEQIQNDKYQQGDGSTTINILRGTTSYIQGVRLFRIENCKIENTLQASVFTSEAVSLDVMAVSIVEEFTLRNISLSSVTQQSSFGYLSVRISNTGILQQVTHRALFEDLVMNNCSCTCLNLPIPSYMNSSAPAFVFRSVLVLMNILTGQSAFSGVNRVEGHNLQLSNSKMTIHRLTPSSHQTTSPTIAINSVYGNSERCYATLFTIFGNISASLPELSPVSNNSKNHKSSAFVLDNISLFNLHTDCPGVSLNVGLKLRNGESANIGGYLQQYFKVSQTHLTLKDIVVEQVSQNVEIDFSTIDTIVREFIPVTSNNSIVFSDLTLENVTVIANVTSTESITPNVDFLRVSGFFLGNAIGYADCIMKNINFSNFRFLSSSSSPTLFINNNFIMNSTFSVITLPTMLKQSTQSDSADLMKTPAFLLSSITVNNINIYHHSSVSIVSMIQSMYDESQLLGNHRKFMVMSELAPANYHTFILYNNTIMEDVDFGEASSSSLLQIDLNNSRGVTGNFELLSNSVFAENSSFVSLMNSNNSNNNDNNFSFTFEDDYAEYNKNIRVFIVNDYDYDTTTATATETLSDESISNIYWKCNRWSTPLDREYRKFLSSSPNENNNNNHHHHHFHDMCPRTSSKSATAPSPSISLSSSQSIQISPSKGTPSSSQSQTQVRTSVSNNPLSVSSSPSFSSTSTISLPLPPSLSTSPLQSTYNTISSIGSFSSVFSTFSSSSFLAVRTRGVLKSVNRIIQNTCGINNNNDEDSSPLEDLPDISSAPLQLRFESGGGKVPAGTLVGNFVFVLGVGLIWVMGHHYIYKKIFNKKNRKEQKEQVEDDNDDTNDSSDSDETKVGGSSSASASNLIIESKAHHLVFLIAELLLEPTFVAASTLLLMFSSSSDGQDQKMSILWLVLAIVLGYILYLFVGFFFTIWRVWFSNEQVPKNRSSISSSSTSRIKSGNSKSKRKSSSLVPMIGWRTKLENMLIFKKNENYDKNSLLRSSHQPATDVGDLEEAIHANQNTNNNINNDSNNNAFRRAIDFFLEPEGEWILDQEKLSTHHRKKKKSKKIPQEQQKPLLLSITQIDERKFNLSLPFIECYTNRFPKFVIFDVLVVVGIALAIVLGSVTDNCLIEGVVMAIVISCHGLLCVVYRPYVEFLFKLMVPVIAALSVIVIALALRVSSLVLELSTIDFFRSRFEYDELRATIESQVETISSLSLLLSIAQLVCAVLTLIGFVLPFWDALRNTVMMKKQKKGNGSGNDEDSNERRNNNHRRNEDDEEDVMMNTMPNLNQQQSKTTINQERREKPRLRKQQKNSSTTAVRIDEIAEPLKQEGNHHTHRFVNDDDDHHNHPPLLLGTLESRNSLLESSPKKKKTVIVKRKKTRRNNINNDHDDGSNNDDDQQQQRQHQPRLTAATLKNFLDHQESLSSPRLRTDWI